MGKAWAGMLGIRNGNPSFRPEEQESVIVLFNGVVNQKVIIILSVGRTKFSTQVQVVVVLLSGGKGMQLSMWAVLFFSHVW